MSSLYDEMLYEKRMGVVDKPAPIVTTETLQMENAAFCQLLTDICNEYMDVGENGQFIGSSLADRANKLLGI